MEDTTKVEAVFAACYLNDPRIACALANSLPMEEQVKVRTAARMLLTVVPLPR